MERPKKSNSSRQLSLDFEPGLTERYPDLLSCVRACAERNVKPLKALAADMDLSVSDLSRKLAGRPDDKRAFTLHDLQKFLTITGDLTPIHWLVERYIESNDSKQQRALSELSRLMPEITALLRAAGTK